MKPMLKSKTVWFNAVSFFIAVLTLPEFLHILPAWVMQYDVLGTAVGNLILRIWFTAEPIQ